MVKTTIYLPKSLKAQLERTAAETQRSEAEVIREGIVLAVQRRKRPQPRSGIFSSGSPSLRQRMDQVMDGFGRD